jgi:hypothetical protein
MNDAIARGILIGGSIGLLLGLTGIVSPGRALGLGLIAGFLAAITRIKLQSGMNRKKEKGGNSGQQ